MASGQHPPCLFNRTCHLLQSHALAPLMHIRAGCAPGIGFRVSGAQKGQTGASSTGREV